MNNFNECGFGGNDCLWIILLMLCCGGCKRGCGCNNIIPVLVALSCCGGSDCGCK